MPGHSPAEERHLPEIGLQNLLPELQSIDDLQLIYNYQPTKKAHC